MIKNTLQTLTIAIVLFIPNFIIAQTDTTKYPVFDLIFEPGVFFQQSDDYKTLYNSKSNFNFSIGTKIGMSNWNYFPWIKYSGYRTNFDIKKVSNNNIDTMLYAKRNQISLGIISPIKISNNNYLQLKCGASYNFITEQSTQLYAEPIGFIMAFGYLKKLSKYINYYVDINYDYAKIKSQHKFNN